MIGKRLIVAEVVHLCMCRGFWYLRQWKWSVLGHVSRLHHGLLTSWWSSLLIQPIVLAQAAIAAPLDPPQQGVVEDTLGAYDGQGGRAAGVCWASLEVDNCMLPPLVLLHGLFSVELLFTDRTLKRPKNWC